MPFLPLFGSTTSSGSTNFAAGHINLARRIGYKNSNPLFEISAPCPNPDGTWPVGTILPYRRLGYRSSKPLGKVMATKCASDGKLVAGKIYPAKRIGYRSDTGKPLFKASCVSGCGGVGYCCGCERFACPGGSFPSSLNFVWTVPCLGTLTRTISLSPTVHECIVDGYGKMASYELIETTTGSSSLNTEVTCPSGVVLGIRTDVDESISISFGCVDPYHDALGAADPGTTICNGFGGWFLTAHWFKKTGSTFLTADVCGLWVIGIPVTGQAATCDPLYFMANKTIECGGSYVTAYPSSYGPCFTYLSDVMFTSGALACVGGAGQVEIYE